MKHIEIDYNVLVLKQVLKTVSRALETNKETIGTFTRAHLIESARRETYKVYEESSKGIEFKIGSNRKIGRFYILGKPTIVKDFA